MPQIIDLTQQRRRIRGMGWKPDLPDARDHEFSPRKFGVSKPKALPKSVDLREQWPLPPFDQGRIGSCTANAIAAAINFAQHKQGRPEFVPSRLFIYYNERVIERTVHLDAGAQIRDGIKASAKVGVPDEELWAYDDTPADEETMRWAKGAMPAKRPHKEVFAAALSEQSVKYARVCQTAQKIKECLASGFPMVFGFTVYDSFEDEEVARTGVLHMPKDGEQIVGGHAVLAVGYTSQDELIVRNSWGTDWGDEGFFTMPLEYVLNRNLADDLWTISLVE